MRFEKFIPAEPLRPYIRQYVVSENTAGSSYKVLPIAGLVIGFQYRGSLSVVNEEQALRLSSAGITGLADSYRIFRSSPNIGTILVYFTETGFSRFCTHPAHELFNLSISLDYLFPQDKVRETEERLSGACTGIQRIRIVERFLLSQLRHIETDRLIMEAVHLIYASKGTVRISELHKKLFISQSPFEKRFRKLVGTSPKKFASIIRFNTVLHDLGKQKSLPDICYEHNFFDQAHFIRDFKQFTGDTPEQFRRLL